MKHAIAVLATISLFGAAACAHGPEPVAGPADYAAVPVQSSAKARLYADCVGQAAATGAYGRAHDPDTEMVVFTCTGAPAKAFFEGLAARSADIGSEVRRGDRIYRSTNAVQRDLFGVDYCVAEGQTHTCVVSLNAGVFLAP